LQHSKNQGKLPTRKPEAPKKFIYRGIKAGTEAEGRTIKEGCAVMSRSRSAFYKHKKRLEIHKARVAVVVELMQEVRLIEPRVGCRKVHRRISPTLKDKGISVGRDKLFAILGTRDMLVKPKRRFTKTTYSKHDYAVAPNRIKGVVPSEANEIFVSDITYLNTREGCAYLFLVTDLFSRKIVGYHLSKNLMHYGAMRALDMAAGGVTDLRGSIHHSDRGCQYCCHEFLGHLKALGMVSSMTDADHCYQNAVAERVNGILKNELATDSNFLSFEAARRSVKEAVRIYNHVRLHTSLNYRTPEEVYAAAA
jgi:putative transposase